MKKRWLAFTLFIMLNICIVVRAEDKNYDVESYYREENIINWEDFEKDMEQIDDKASFFEIKELGLKMLVLSDFKQTDFFKTLIDPDFYAHFTSEDKKANIVVMKVEDATLEEIADAIIESSEVAENYLINGHEAIVYTSEFDNILVAFYEVNEEGDVVEFGFSPVWDPDRYAKAIYMITSIQSIE